MKSEELRHLTASEPLTLEQEYAMQGSWREDEDSEERPPPPSLPGSLHFPVLSHLSATAPLGVSLNCGKKFGGCLCSNHLKWRL